jgi:hypothetical protein
MIADNRLNELASWDEERLALELEELKSLDLDFALEAPRPVSTPPTEVNVLRKKLSYPELKRAVIDQDARFSPQAILIEDRATIENGFVCLPHEAPWIADYLAEFAAFPRGRHDYQVDSTAPGAGVARGSIGR